MTFTWHEFKTQVEKLGVKDDQVIDCIFLAATHTSKSLDIRHLPGNSVMIFDEHTRNGLSSASKSTPEPAQ